MDREGRASSATLHHGRPRKIAHRISWVLFGLISVWFLLMRQFGGADIYSVLGPYALSVAVVLWLLRPRATRRWLTPTRSSVLWGLLVGVAMTLLTYPVYAFAAQRWLGLADYVKQLYAAAATAPLWLELMWVSVIIFAEELLWRGFLQEDLERKLPRDAALLTCVLVYTLAQLGSGSWVVGAMAAVCGLIWSLERRLTGSLVAPLISHLIWTPTVILLHPVT